MTPDGVDLSDQEYLKRSFHGGNMWQHAATCVNMPIRQINASCYHHVIASLHIVAYRCISLHIVALFGRFGTVAVFLFLNEIEARQHPQLLNNA